MKTLFTSPLVVLVLISLSMTAAADSVKEIVDGLQKEKAAKLEAYLQENPKAEDRLEGVSHLIIAYMNLGQTDKLEPLLKEKYDLMVTGKDIKDVGLDELLGGAARPLIMSLRAAGKKKEAREFYARVKGELAGHPMAQQLSPFLQQIEAMLDAPGGGEVLDISFTDINGDKVDLAAMKGKVVLVDFWATWCPPCLEEFPNMLKMYSEYHDEGLEIVGISLDEDVAGAKRFVEVNKIPWLMQIEGKSLEENKFSKKYNIPYLPSIFVIGKDGKIAASFLSGAELRQAIKLELQK